MKTFTLGWEFPPFISGGLGTACYGLTKAMDRLGIQITFVLPKTSDISFGSHVKMLSAEGHIKTAAVSEFKNVSFCRVTSPLRPYVACGTYEACLKEKKSSHIHLWHSERMEQPENYGRDIYEQIHRYADKAAEIATVEDFDIIHAHDWMTYPAGIAVAKVTRKPLLVHVHSTEFDRSGKHVNQMIYGIERQGMDTAVKVIAVSSYTRNIIISRYGIQSEKVEVVYNGVERNSGVPLRTLPDKTEKIVLFLGRITMQKGPEYFLAAAKEVLEKIENVKFVMAGEGDMLHRSIELAAQMRIGHKVLFTRFLHGSDVDKMYQMADLYVMPSVSEPFGIAPLEALQHHVPVLISKQSGVAETLNHVLKVDFWDINEMTNKIVAVLKYPALHKTLCDNGYFETYKFRWEDTAHRVNRIYEVTVS